MVFINITSMEDKVREIIIGVEMTIVDPDEAIDRILDLHNTKLSLFQKNRLDLLNWAKSELKQETNPKIGKTMTPYRSDKIIFLRRVIDWINNEV